MVELGRNILQQSSV